MRIGEARDVLQGALRLAESRIKVGRSSSNPGYLSVTIPSQDALRALSKVFPEMEGVDWLTPPTEDSLGYDAYKDGDGRWAGWVWWEDKHAGLELFIRDDIPGLTVRVEPRSRSLKRETHSYGKIPGRHIQVKQFAMRSVQAYLRGVQDGTNGTDRSFARRTRAPVKAGGAAQTRAIERIKALAAAKGREVEVKEPDSRGDVRLTVPKNYDLQHGFGQKHITIWVSKLGRYQATVPEDDTPIMRGRKALAAIERELGRP